MFKKNTKLAGLMKRQLALVLSIIMAISCFATAGLSFSSVFAAPVVDDYGYCLAEKAVEIVTSNPSYVEGANTATEMDSKSFLTQALTQTYGHTDAYLVSEAQGGGFDPVLDGNGNKVYINLATMTPENLNDYLGQFICLAGDGFVTYYEVTKADTVVEGDIIRGGIDYHSDVSRAGKYRGSIVYYNGKYAIALGHYDDADRFINEYTDLGYTISDVDFNELAYNYGETYRENDNRYWFGKTLFAYAQDVNNGIGFHNVHTPGDLTADHEGVIVLQTISDPTTIDFVIEQYDSNNNPVAGVTYEIYVDENCTTLATVTGSNPATTDANGKIHFNSEAIPAYYLKQTAVPAGYTLNNEIIKVIPHGKNDLIVKLYLTEEIHPIHIQVLDRYDTGKILRGSVLALEEWSETDQEYQKVATLKYNEYSQTFTLDDDYTNTVGQVVKDRQLHTTAENLGKFRVTQEDSQPGYAAHGTNSISIDLSDPNTDGTLDDEFTLFNEAIFVVDILAVYPDNTPVSGQEFKITYDGDEFAANDATDNQGNAAIEGLAPGSIREKANAFPTLYQTNTNAPKGYLVSDLYKNGFVFNFNKDPESIRDHAFVTNLTVSLVTDENYVPFQYGQININKNDNMMVVDPGNHGIEGAVYGVYTDAECTIFAQDKDGAILNNVVTDVNGNATVKVDEGVYYVKEIGTTNGYATNKEIKVFNFDESQADKNNNGIIVVDAKFDTRKQVVTLSTTVKDSESNKPIAGAVVKLYTKESIIVPTTGQTIGANVLLGYYKTDASGKVLASKIGSDAFDGYNAYYPKDVNGNLVDDDALLPNGKYYFQLDQAINSYVYDADYKVEFNAAYVKNELDTAADYEEYSVSGKGLVLVMDNKDFTIIRQTGKINFSIKDADVTHPSEYYGVSDGTYDALADKKMVASFDGAVVHLYTKTDVVDIVTGEIIPAGTFVGLYNLENGAVVIDKFTAAAYNDHAIPNGEYKLVLDIASVGYIVENKEVEVSLVYDANKTQVEATASIDEIVVKQHVSVKSKSDTNQPVAGAKYDIYSVAKIIDILGVAKEDLPWNPASEPVNGFNRLTTADVLALVEGKVTPEETITSGDDGVATTTNKLVFGEYIIIPHKTPGFGVPESVYIRIPTEGGDFVLPPLDTVEFEIVSAEKKFTVSATTNVDYPAGINDTPVVKKGDEVTYTFKVVNTGSTAVDNIVVNIPVPAGMTYVTSKLGDGVNGQFWLNDDIVAGIDKIDVGGAATIEVTFSVDAQISAIYSTTATYGRFEEAPVALPVLPDTANTVDVPAVQSIAFEKSADFTDGVVSVGDEITYTFKISAPKTIYYTLLTDEIPDGLTFIEGSLEAKIADEEWENISDESLHEVEDGVFAFYCGTLGGVDCFVRFKVKVDNIAVNTDKTFTNKAELMYEKNRVDDDNINFDTIESNEVSHIVDIKVSESEIGTSKPTYIGKYGEKTEITVLKDGDEYSYSVPVKNEGTSSIKNLVIKTKIADKAKFVEADLDGKYNEETGEVTWVIPEIKPGEEIKVTVKCKVATGDEAAELVNDVFYAFSDDVSNVKADEWIQLDSVIYQTIKAELSASIEGGKTADEAASVKIGDKVTYTGKFTILNKVYGFSFTDKLPKGISYVDGSLKFVDADGKTVEVKVTVNDGVLTIDAIDLEAGVYTVTFDTTVDDVTEADKTFVYENKLEVSVKENKTSDEKVAVETNAIFVKTIKETPKLGVNVANKTFVWVLISIISAISSIALAAYYFVDKKKSVRA